MRRPLRSLKEARVPRGAVLLLGALICALPAALALGHSLRYDSQGRWLHQHTTIYSTCNLIDGDNELKDKANDARRDWHQIREESGVGVPWVADCHSPKANLELRDGRYGNTGWRASAWDSQTNNNPVGYHNDHTHLQFNLDNLGGQNVTPYVKRTLACRTIGAGLGLTLASGNEGPDNDCMSFWGSIQTERSKKDYPNNYTYSNQPGAHAAAVLAEAYGDHAVELTLNGPLAEAATSNDHLTADTYSLEVMAAPSTSPDPTVDLAQVEVLIDSEVAAIATPPCAGCPIVHEFDLETDSYADGPHTIEVSATDELGLGESESLAISIDRRGGIQHVLEVTGDPSQGGEVLSEQWADPATEVSRTDDGESVTTRSGAPCDPNVPGGSQCVQMRQLTALDADEDAYTVYTGANDGDERIDGRAWILEPARFDTAPTAQGPISQVLAPWQSAPPGHGSTYETYEFADTARFDDPAETEDDEDVPPGAVEVIARHFVDSATKLPLKSEGVGPNGESLGEAFFTYHGRVEQGTLPPDFFAVEPTSSVVLDEEVTFLGADPVGPEVDDETGENFEPHYLGTEPTVADQVYCLATSHVIHLEEEVDDAVPGDVEDDPENALDPALDVAETSVGASYNVVGPGEACVPGDGSLLAPPLDVISESTASPDAQAWRGAYREEAEAIDADPDSDPGFGGVMEVTFQGEPRIAYAVPDDRGMSVMVVGDGVQVTITGDFHQSGTQSIAGTENEAQSIVDLLEPL